LGKFDKALATYKMAAELTPASITRLQNLGMMTYYSGDRAEAESILARTARLGLDSKMFDCQTLVLLAFTHLDSGDGKGLQRCRDDFARLIEKNPKSQRHQRLADIVEALSSIQRHQYAQALDAVRSMTQAVKSPDFDFEAASNLLALMANLAHKAIQLDEVESMVDVVGLRFCTNRSMTELLAGAAAVHPPYAERVREAHTQILKLTEHAMMISMEGDPGAAVKNLIFHGSSTLNGKLIETAHLVLHRYAEKIADAHSLTETIQELRTRFATYSTKPVLGEQKRQAGGLTLRTGVAPAKVPISLS
jgi:uncharacterized protein YdaU (DUF1376 family)